MKPLPGTAIQSRFCSILLVAMGSAVSAGECEPHWLTEVGNPGLEHTVHALAVLNDGTGPALYAGGVINVAGGKSVSNIARWDGSNWSDVKGGVDSTVRVLEVFDLGDGPALYAGGSFSSAGGVTVDHVARWDGSKWSAVGQGMEHVVQALAVYDDGTGPSLYAGTAIGNGERHGVWRLDGNAWSIVGGGLRATRAGDVNALAVFNDGSGPALYAGGLFNEAGEATVANVAWWDGRMWHAAGGGVNENVFAMHAFEDGDGPSLVVGGTFLEADGIPSIGLARWNGARWQAIGPPFPEAFFGIFALAIVDDGEGSALYASGVDGFETNRLFRWDGEVLSVASAHGAQTVSALQPLQRDGSAASLFVAGTFLAVEDQTARSIAEWRGCPPVQPADLDGDGTVGFGDIIILLAAWGDCPPVECPADLDGDGSVGLGDLLSLLSAWSA